MNKKGDNITASYVYIEVVNSKEEKLWEQWTMPLGQRGRKSSTDYEGILIENKNYL